MNIVDTLTAIDQNGFVGEFRGRDNVVILTADDRAAARSQCDGIIAFVSIDEVGPVVATMLSKPKPPTMVLLPAPALIVSSPPLPKIRSLPEVVMRLSAPSVESRPPTMVLLPEPALMESGRPPPG